MDNTLINSENDKPCETCKENPCVCNNDNTTPKEPEPKPRVKGSHRNGTSPKLKWL
jgi:hypothetical protein